MHSPVDIMSPIFTLEMKGIQRSNGVFVSCIIFYNITINH